MGAEGFSLISRGVRHLRFLVLLVQPIRNHGAKMKNTRTIKIGERVLVSRAGRGSFEGMVTENNAASWFIYVDGRAYARCDVRRLSYALEN